MVGDQVTVRVVAINGGQVKLGINAPKDVAVHREEVYVKLRRERPDEGK